MKVTPGLPVTALSGTSKNSQLVYYPLGEQLVARARVEPENPRTYNRRFQNPDPWLWQQLEPLVQTCPIGGDSPLADSCSVNLLCTPRDGFLVDVQSYVRVFTLHCGVLLAWFLSTFASQPTADRRTPISTTNLMHSNV
jgi:hypothetical protein